MKYNIITLLMIGMVNAKALQSSKGQIAAKNFVIILKYMDKHGCKMQKKINDIAHIYKGAIYRQTSNAVSCATFGKKDDGISGGQIWKSDGTSEGTLRVSNERYTRGTISHLIDVSSTLFFTAGTAEHGIEL